MRTWAYVASVGGTASLLWHAWLASLGGMAASWSIIVVSLLLMVLGLTALANTERKG